MEIIKIDQLQTEGHDIAGLVSTQFVDFSIIILFFHLYSIKRRREKKLCQSTNSVIEWPSMRKQVFRGLLTYVRLFDVVE